MIKHILKYSKYCFVALFFVMLCITFLLIREYSFFKKQVMQLHELKQDYTTYVSTLKKLIAQSDQLKFSPETNQGEEKKKELMTEENQDSFIVLNRDFDHLKSSGIAFAKKHNLEDAVEKMYEADEWVAFSEILKQKRRSKKVSRSRIYSRNVPRISALHDDTEFKIQKLSRRARREPIFHWPIEKRSFWLSSFFGPRKKSDGSWGFHTGVDMAASKGTFVKSAGSGIVTQAGYESGYGNTVVVTHDRKFKTRYAHLDKILVKTGAKVDQNVIIGKVGDTGFVRKKGRDASHLHFEVYVFGKQINPFYFMI
ncbi:M23 family metallopeptidase [Candidatus Dependentiae bacterium]|nr:M23 family metallopeptidase [Candidatus Dependentiae bacterium]